MCEAQMFLLRVSFWFILNEHNQHQQKHYKMTEELYKRKQNIYPLQSYADT